MAEVPPPGPDDERRRGAPPPDIFSAPEEYMAALREYNNTANASRIISERFTQALHDLTAALQKSTEQTARTNETLRQLTENMQRASEAEERNAHITEKQARAMVNLAYSTRGYISDIGRLARTTGELGHTWGILYNRLISGYAVFLTAARGLEFLSTAVFEGVNIWFRFADIQLNVRNLQIRQYMLVNQLAQAQALYNLAVQKYGAHSKEAQAALAGLQYYQLQVQANQQALRQEQWRLNFAWASSIIQIGQAATGLLTLISAGGATIRILQSIGRSAGTTAGQMGLLARIASAIGRVFGGLRAPADFAGIGLGGAARGIGGAALALGRGIMGGFATLMSAFLPMLIPMLPILIPIIVAIVLIYLLARLGVFGRLFGALSAPPQRQVYERAGERVGAQLVPGPKGWIAIKRQRGGVIRQEELALLHPGEAVLPAPLVQALMGRGAGSPVGGAAISPRTLDQFKTLNVLTERQNRQTEFWLRNQMLLNVRLRDFQLFTLMATSGLKNVSDSLQKGAGILMVFSVPLILVLALFQWFKDALDTAGKALKAFFDALQQNQALQGLSKAVQDFVNTIVDKIKNLGPILQSIWSTIAQGAINFGKLLFDAIVGTFKLIATAGIDFGRLLIDAIVGAFKLIGTAGIDFGKLLIDAIVGAFKLIAMAGVDVGKLLIDAIIGTFKLIATAGIDFGRLLIDAIVGSFKLIAVAIVDFGHLLITAGGGAILVFLTIVRQIPKVFAALPDAIIGSLQLAIGGLANLLAQGIQVIQQTLVAIAQLIDSVFGTHIAQSIQSAGSGIINYLQQFGQSMVQSGAQHLANFEQVWVNSLSEVQTSINKWTTDTTQVWNKLTSDISQQTTQLGDTLTSDWNKFTGDISQSQNQLSQTLSADWQKLTSDISQMGNQLGQTLTADWNKLTSDIGQLGNQLVNTLTADWTKLTSDTTTMWNQLGQTLTADWRTFMGGVSSTTDTYADAIMRKMGQTTTVVSQQTKAMVAEVAGAAGQAGAYLDSIFRARNAASSALASLASAASQAEAYRDRIQRAQSQSTQPTTTTTGATTTATATTAPPPSARHLQTGGIITRQIMALLHPGEIVLPKHLARPFIEATRGVEPLPRTLPALAPPTRQFVQHEEQKVVNMHVEPQINITLNAEIKNMADLRRLESEIRAMIERVISDVMRTPRRTLLTPAT